VSTLEPVEMTAVAARLSEDGQRLLLEFSHDTENGRTVSLPRTALPGLATSLVQLDRVVMNLIVVDEGGPEG
jgi:hypothetical protein